MLEVTERAKQELKKILTDNIDNPQAGLRLSTATPGGYGLSPDMEAPGDYVVEHEGLRVLLVEEGLASNLEGVTLDVQDTPEGPRLAVYTT